MPVPPSTVADPPRPSTTLCAPESKQCRRMVPTPIVSARSGSRTSGGNEVQATGLRGLDDHPLGILPHDRGHDRISERTGRRYPFPPSISGRLDRFEQARPAVGQGEHANLGLGPRLEDAGSKCRRGIGRGQAFLERGGTYKNTHAADRTPSHGNGRFLKVPSRTRSRRTGHARNLVKCSQLQIPLS